MFDPKSSNLFVFQLIIYQLWVPMHSIHQLWVPVHFGSYAFYFWNCWHAYVKAMTEIIYKYWRKDQNLLTDLNLQ